MPETTLTVQRSSTPRQEPDRFGFVIPEEEVFLMDQYDHINFKAATADLDLMNGLKP